MFVEKLNFQFLYKLFNFNFFIAYLFDFYDLDVGDVVEFSNMYPKKAFGKNFVDLVFMVTSISRTVGSIKFEARQIADNN